MSMASGSASSCSNGDANTTKCIEYTVFKLSKKVVRFVFYNVEGGLSKCDVALGSGVQYCTFLSHSGVYNLSQFVQMAYTFTWMADLSILKIS
jgi:hypothetical protein